MIYANAGGAFPGLYKLLETLGYTESIRERAVAFLNIETPESKNAFKDTKPETLYISQYYAVSDKIKSVVLTEILQSGNKTLQERYIQLAWNLAGSTCLPLLNALSPGAIQEGLTAVYGERADAMMLAMQADNLMYFCRELLPPLLDREKCMEAARLCTAHVPKGATLLCSAVLELSDLPEKSGILTKLLPRKPDPLVQEAVERIEKAIPIADDSTTTRPYYEWTTLLYRAVAAGAPFSQKLSKELETSCRFSDKDVLTFAIRIPVRPEKIAGTLTEHARPDQVDEMIAFLASPSGFGINWEKKEHAALRRTCMLTLCRKYPRTAAKVMADQKKPAAAVYILKALEETGSADRRTEEMLRTHLQKECTKCLLLKFDNLPGLESYLMGGGSIVPIIEPLVQNMADRSYYGLSYDYVSAFGLDGFAQRVLCVQLLAGRHTYSCPGIPVKGQEKKIIQILKGQGIPAPILVRICASAMEWEHIPSGEPFYAGLAGDAPEIASCNTAAFSVPARIFRIHLLHRADPVLYRDAILASAGDTSKLVREALLDLLKQHPEWHPEQLLTAKSVKARELALQAVEAMGADNYREILEKAGKSEKSAALRDKIHLLLGTESTEPKKQEDIVETLTKGGKAKKLAWLFTQPFSPVRMGDGSQAPETLLQAFLLDYAGNSAFGRSAHCKFFSEQLDPADTQRFALEVFSRWLDGGAPAKQKWILCFSNAHGGERVLELTKRCIKEWSEKARGAIAADAVRAIAYNESPVALVILDDYARTFKKAQVKDAAAGALREAARQLGLTTEELADRIVPDLGFSARSERVFDYGNRQFTVTLLPGMQLGVRCGDKTLRSLPKPGAKDDPAMADAAYKAFSDLKKQLRMVYKLQQQRMEYALLCGRTWKIDSWKELMLEKPVMHPLAESLVWGIYDENGLTDTFRYMDDGSFADKNADAFELPENGRIGLVHPLELTKETLDAWREQLEDFEITQPFPQIDRIVHRVPEEKKDGSAYKDLKGCVLNCMSLRSKMKKYGWATGEVLDGGFFNTFIRTDILGFTCGQDEAPVNQGLGAVLHFSGMDISGYFQEDVTIDTVQFYAIEGNTHRALRLGEVPPQYYSEIIGQLETGVRTEKEDA